MDGTPSTVMMFGLGPGASPSLFVTLGFGTTTTPEPGAGTLFWRSSITRHRFGARRIYGRRQW